MSQIPCCHCGGWFAPSPRHKNQIYCGEPECQRARKAAWQKHKLRTDPDYRFNQRLSQKRWIQSQPGYWTEYRRSHPDKAERNRLLQHIRNRRARKTPAADPPPARLIAKMDASHPEAFEVLGRFWLLPLIAKMDALKVHILKIPASYP